MTARADLTIANGRRLAEIAKATGCAIEVKVGDRVIRIIPDSYPQDGRGIDRKVEIDL